MDDAHRGFLSEGEGHGARYALSAPKNAAMGVTGMRLGRSAGSSLDFMDHREYQPGDDLRLIDWSAYARSDRMIVKLYREEISPHLDLVIDGSRSMDLAGSAKPRAALGLAGVLAAAAANAGFTRRAYVASEGCQSIANGNERPTAWEGVAFEGRQSLAVALRQLPPRGGRAACAWLFSDLLFPADPPVVLGTLAQGAAAVVVVQVLAAADAEPPQRGNMRLVDAETGQVREVFLDAAAQRRYRENLARHRDDWHRACRQAGATFVSLIAEDLVAGWNLEAFVAAGVLRVD